MDFCQTIFGKGIYDIELSDVENFFNDEQEESSILEFKSGKVELEEVYREISAFLNTEGGVLIIGAPQEQKVRINNVEKKVCKGQLTASHFSNQDNLIRSISSNISPAPYKIKAKEFIHNGGKVFVLEISQSLTPPHQVSNDGKYYIRLEREAKPAPHGIIEALFFKRQKPNLDVGFSISTHIENRRQRKVDFILKNTSLVTAENIGFIIELGGIAEILDTTNVLKDDLKINNTFVQYQDTYNKNILVKGLFNIITFEVLTTSDFILMDCTFYCKDSQAERKVAIYNNNSGDQLIKWYNSRNDDESFAIEIYEQFINLKSQQSQD